MAARFWMAAALFHAGMLVVTALMARRWVGRLKKPRAGWLWSLFILADSVTFATAAGVLAAFTAPLVPEPAFAALRLVSQAIFGEGLLLALGVAGLHLRERAPRVRVGVLLGLTAAILLAYWEGYHHGPYNLQVRTHRLTSAAPAKTPVRILHLSDLQTHAIRGYERRVFAAAAATRPDLVVFTGDYIQPRLGSRVEPAWADFRRLLEETNLRPPLGFYAVGGDVEADEGGDWQRRFEGLPVTCLENSVARTPLPDGRTLALVGLEIETSRGRDAAPVHRLLREAQPADALLVLGHRPDFVQQLVGRDEVNLALAGHTHGGQVVLPVLGPLITLSRLPTRHAGGMSSYRGVPLHVSRGIGMERMSAPQVRFLCPPEICVIEAEL
ncbi:MAG: metallophosphoesterase [Armatimonadota bacterium]